MQFPESWLREFCNPALSTAQLAETLTMAGLEVEALQTMAPPFTGVVVGAITAAEPHPNADRLRVCQVDIGPAGTLSVVCGAANARVGIRVPCAVVGAVLPAGADGKPWLIQVGQLRGVESQGMLCSARELGLSQDHGGLLELALDAPLGQDIRAHLALDDSLFTLKLTPNLAHCLSVYGVAREVAALTGAPLLSPRWPVVAVQHTERLPVTVSAPDLCGRFSGRIVRNVNPRASTPPWMVDRLLRCGQRSVSVLVDISNYVMFELGRPSHVFDLDKIHGGLDVRWARPGEQLKLLNGSCVTLDEKVGVIADAHQVESLAGIMGGDATAVSDDSRNIYVEAAFWWPKSIAGRSRRYNFSTDAGHRFERGVDPMHTVEHLERITQLIVDICGGEAGPVDDTQLPLPPVQSVRMRVARAVKVLGMPLTQAQCADALQRLGLPLTQEDGVLTVTPPSYRFDLAIEEDLIEEVMRMVGYDKLPTSAPLAPTKARLRPENQRSPFALRHHLAHLGYQETINFSFVDARWEAGLAGNSEPIELLNPISSQMSVMRSSLLGSLLQVLMFNLDRKATRVRVFELGSTFLRNPAVQNTDTTVAGFEQTQRVAGLAYGAVAPLQWGSKERTSDFYDAKADVEALLAPAQAQFLPAEHPAMHPGRCARVLLNGQEIGFVGELHPRWRQHYGMAQAPVLFELDLAPVLQRSVPVFSMVAKHQSVERDLAVIVPEAVTSAQVLAAVHSGEAEDWLRAAVLFDVYRPAPTKLDAGMPAPAASATGIAVGEKSLALRLTLNAGEQALSEAHIDAAVAAVLARLVALTGARLRT